MRKHAPLMSLSLPPNMAVFNLNPNARKDSNSDEEMMDVFPPIPILPVPTVPDSTPDAAAGFPVPGMTPLAPPAVPWMPPRPAPPPNAFHGIAPPPFSIPAPHNIPLPAMSPHPGPAIPNLSQIPLPAPMPVHPSQVPLPGPLPLPGPRLGATAPVPTNPPPVSGATPLFKYGRSPSPPSPRTLARNMRESDSESEPEHHKRANQNEPPGVKIHPGSLPPFRRSSSPKNNIYLTGGPNSSPSPMDKDRETKPRVHAGSLPPFNSSVPISRTVPSPSTRPGEPRFVNSMQSTTPVRPASPGFPRFNNPSQFSVPDNKSGDSKFVNSMRSTSPGRNQTSPAYSRFGGQETYSPPDPSSDRSNSPGRNNRSSPGIPRFNNQNQFSSNDSRPPFMDQNRTDRPRPPGDPQNFPGPDMDRNNSTYRPSLEEMRGPVQPRPNFADLQNMPRFNSGNENSGSNQFSPGMYRGGPPPRQQFGRPPPPQFGGQRGGFNQSGSGGQQRPRFNGPPGPPQMRQRGPFRMTFKLLGNMGSRPPFGN